MSTDFLDFVCDQLHAVDGLRSRSMFGGHGLYGRDVFFGIVANGRLYFKTDETTSPQYKKEGMDCFEPNPGQILKNYYEVPVDVIEDDRALSDWAGTSIEVASKK